MPGDPVLVRRGHIEGTRPHHQLQANLYGERSFHTGTDKIPAELAMCRMIVRVLNEHYPGHPWSVEVMADQGVAKISIPELLGQNWGYILHLDTMMPRDVVKAGGEILERFKIPRAAVDLSAYAQAQSTIPLIGRFKPGHGKLIPR